VERQEFIQDGKTASYFLLDAFRGSGYGGSFCAFPLIGRLLLTLDKGGDRGNNGWSVSNYLLQKSQTQHFPKAISKQPFIILYHQNIKLCSSEAPLPPDIFNFFKVTKNVELVALREFWVCLKFGFEVQQRKVSILLLCAES
jgi:hypothetical protein